MDKIGITIFIVISIATIVPNAILITKFIKGEYSINEPTQWGFFHFLCFWLWIIFALINIGIIIHHFL